MKNIIYIFILISTFSCKKEELKKPENFIEKDKMIDLILDMKIAEKARTVLTKDKVKKQNYMSFVYEKYHIDSTQFKESSDYYTEKLELYEEIYTVVKKRLNDSVKKYEALKTQKDSIAREKKKKKKTVKPTLNKEVFKNYTNKTSNTKKVNLPINKNIKKSNHTKK